MDISFGWTAPAIFAREKLVTRRTWKESHARKFTEGRVCTVLDKVRYHGGRPIARIRLTRDAYLEHMSFMPDSDYKAEGFAFLYRHPELVPANMPISVSPEGFEAWRRGDYYMWVVRFEIEEILVSKTDQVYLNILNILEREIA